ECLLGGPRSGLAEIPAEEKRDGDTEARNRNIRIGNAGRQDSGCEGNLLMATQAVTLARPMTPSSAGVILPAFTLWWREIVRFYRQPGRVVGVLASPLVFWLVLGSGFGNSFRSGAGSSQQHYLDYFYPGTLILIVLFTSIFTMMSVIDDRKEGFLLSVLVAPVSRTAIVLG